MTWLNSNSVLLGAFLCAGTRAGNPANHAPLTMCAIGRPLPPRHSASGGEGAKLPQSAQRSRSGFECRYSVSSVVNVLYAPHGGGAYREGCEDKVILGRPPRPCLEHSTSDGNMNVLASEKSHAVNVACAVSLSRRPAFFSIPAGFLCIRKPGSSSSPGSGHTCPFWRSASRRRRDRPR